MALTRLKTEGFALLPSLQSERARSLRACHRITHVKISDSVKIDGTTYCRIQVFYEKPTSNIPTCRRLKLSPSEKPGAVVLQQFSAFANLSHELSYQVEVAHGFQLWPFCEAVTSTLRRDRPRFRTRLFGADDTIRMQLERLITSGLALIRDRLHSSSYNCCNGQREVPILLARFLST
jgi:hypothetical protein